MGRATARIEAARPKGIQPREIESKELHPGELRSREPRRISVRIRTASVADDGFLVALRRQAEQVHARLLPDYFRVTTPPRAQRQPPQQRPEKGPSAVAGASSYGGAVTLVAEASRGRHPILGYVTLRLVETPRDPAITPRRRAHVETVVVDEAHRGRGVGTALMRAAAIWARDRQAAELVLTVWSENRAAEALYKGLGFRQIARVLSRPIDA